MPRYRPGKGAAQAEAEHGIVEAVKLASNETPWSPIASVVEAMRVAVDGVNRYPDHRAAALRERLAQWLDVAVEQVTVGAGSATLIQQLYLAYVDPGDRVVYPWRSFEVYPVYARLTAAEVVPVPLVDHAFDLEAVAAAVTPATKLVLLANPNNPTGTTVTTAEIGRLLDRITSDTLLVIDEAYREFAGASHGDPLADLLPHHDNLVVLRTFSKAQGLAGVRVGYGIAHPEVVATVDATAAPFSVNVAAQAGAIAAIDGFDEVKERVDSILAERDRVVAALRSSGCSLPDPGANFVWLPLGDRTDHVALELEKAGVVVRPFSDEGIRVTIGAAGENDRFLSALGDALNRGGGQGSPPPDGRPSAAAGR